MQRRVPLFKMQPPFNCRMIGRELTSEFLES